MARLAGEALELQRQEIANMHPVEVQNQVVKRLVRLQCCLEIEAKAVHGQLMGVGDDPPSLNQSQQARVREINLNWSNN